MIERYQASSLWQQRRSCYKTFGLCCERSSINRAAEENHVPYRQTGRLTCRGQRNGHSFTVRFNVNIGNPETDQECCQIQAATFESSSPVVIKTDDLLITAFRNDIRKFAWRGATAECLLD